MLDSLNEINEQLRVTKEVLSRVERWNSETPCKGGKKAVKIWKAEVKRLEEIKTRWTDWENRQEMSAAA
jgi:hypothetical protein